MLIDLIVCILLLMAVFKGLRKGLILALFTFIGFILGLAAAIKLSAVAAVYLGEAISISQRWLPVLAFVVVFLVVVVLVRLGARALEGAVQLAMLGWANRLGGVVLYGLVNIFIFSILLFYADRIGWIRPEAASASLTYPYIRPLGPYVVDGLGAVVPLFKNMFGELEGFFENASGKVAA